MSAFRRYFKYMAVFTVTLTLSLVGVNMAIDPYADLSYLLGRTGHPPLSVNQLAERKYKAALIEGLPEGSLSWAVFGNSRATAIDISRGVPGFEGPGANLAFSGGNLDQIHTLIRTAKTRHPALRPLVAVDLDHCLQEPSSEFLYLSPATNRESRIDALARLSSMGTLYAALWSVLGPSSLQEIEITPMGHNTRHLGPGDETKIRGRMEDDRRVYGHFFRNFPYKTACIEILREIRAENPGSVIIINPVSGILQDTAAKAGKSEEIARWRRDLKAVAPVIDFTCARHITDRWQNYADAHHYRGTVGALMLNDVGRLLAGKPLQTGCLIGAD